MKTRTFSLLLIGALTALQTIAQSTAASSGKITYEGMRRIDRSQMRMAINGQEVRPGSGDAPEGLPDVVSFTQKLVFSGTMAKEERDRPQNMMMRRQMDGGGNTGGNADGRRPRDFRMNAPFDQQTYLDLANRKRVDVMTITKDSVRQVYRSERALPDVSDWKDSDKTKKIAGYTCHKATATHRKETYTVWYTTDLPFTYSPVADLTPPKGVVLQIESDNESYKASGVAMENVAANTVEPPADAKVVTSDEMEQMRRKTMADFRQRMMSNMPSTPRN